MRDLFPEDVQHRIKKDFGNDAPFVLELLTNYHAYLCTTYRRSDACGFRLIRCILHCAKGNFFHLQYALDASVSDYRNLIVSGEYDHNLNQIRDLSKPFEGP